MDSATSTGQKAALSDYLAAERTLLAWIRTGLALMGFGFVVARFGLFLQQIQTSGASTRANILWILALVRYGAHWIRRDSERRVFAGWHHLRLVRDLDSGAPFHSRPTMQVAAVSFVQALVWLAMAIFLISIRR